MIPFSRISPNKLFHFWFSAGAAKRDIHEARRDNKPESNSEPEPPHTFRTVAANESFLDAVLSFDLGQRLLDLELPPTPGPRHVRNAMGSLSQALYKGPPPGKLFSETTL